MIHIVRLSKLYGYLPALKQLDLTIPRGQFVALLGANGSGKSTLLRLIWGLSQATSGDIWVGGWHMPREAAQVRAQIGLVSHKPLVYDNLTARENLQFFARLYHLPQHETEARINTLLERVGLKKRADTLARTYSRGMQQRLSIARALLPNPHVLLFDEPHTGLDQTANATLDALLREAHQDGHTIIMTTHDLDRAANLSERAIILQRGTVVHDAPPTADLKTVYAQVTGTSATP